MIKIDERFYVTVDSFQYILMEKKYKKINDKDKNKKNDNEENKNVKTNKKEYKEGKKYYFYTIGYYSSLHKCIEKYIQIIQKENVFKDKEDEIIEIKEVLSILKKTKDDIEKLLYPIRNLEKISDDLKNSEGKGK